MQAVIGALRANLGLDSAQFERGARRSQTASQRLQKDLRRMATVAAAAGAALVAMAMRGANEIDRLAKAGRRLDTSIAGMRALELAAGEAGVGIGSLADAVQNLDREVASGSQGAAAALERLGLAAADLEGFEADQKLALIADRVKQMGLNTGEASRLLQEFGLRNRDMVLLLMQGGDALRAARSDVDDYGLALNKVDAAAIETANDQIGRLRLVVQFLQQELARNLVPAFGRMAEAITDSLREGGRLRSVIEAIASNIRTLITVAATAVASFTIYRGILLSVALAKRGLALASNGLRSALLRLGFPALIIAAGLLVDQFLKLVEKTGGWGEALGLLSDVAVEVWDRIKMGAASAGARATAMFFDIKADAASAMASAISSVVDFGNSAVNTFQGTFYAVQAVWNALPDVFRRIGALAMNTLIEAMQLGLAGVTEAINTILTLGGRRPEWAIAPPDLSDWKAAVPDAVDIGGRAAEGFARGFETNLLAVPDLGLEAIASEALSSANTYRKAAEDLARGTTAPLASIQALRNAMSDVETNTDNAADAADRLKAAMEGLAGDEGGGRGGGGRSVVGQAISAFEQLGQSIKSSMEQGFMSIIDGTKNAADAFRDMARQILAELFRVLVVQRLVGSFGEGGKAGTGILSAIGRAFSIGANANGTSNWRGGMTLVGERGPELVNLPRGSQVIDAQSTSRRMGGGDVIQHFNFNLAANGDESVRRIVAQAAPQIVEAAKTGVLDARRRGGAYRAAFG